jgi:hypothetical protein
MPSRVALALTLLLALTSWGQNYNIPIHVVHTPPLGAPRPVDDSYVGINVGIDLAKVTALAKAAFPTHLEWETADYKTYFDLKTGPNTYVYPAKGNDPAHLGIIATYMGEFETKSILGGCHLKYLYPMPYIQFFPGIQREGQTWIIGAAEVHAQISLRPDSDTQCGTCPFDCRDISAQVLAILNNAPQFTTVVQKLTDQVAFREHYIQGWKDFSAPQSFPTGTPNEKICVYPGIKSITSGPVMGPFANKAVFTVGFGLNPIVQIAQECLPGVSQPIDVTPGWSEVPGWMDLHITLPLLYSDITSKVDAQLTGLKDLRLESKPFQITSASVGDAGGRFFLAIQVSGKINGRVYFWGTPTLNREKTSIVVADLKLADESRRAIESQKKGLASEFLEALGDYPMQASNLDISASVAKLTSSLEGDHPSQRANLNFDLIQNSVQPISAYSVPGAIFIEIDMFGGANLSILQ